VVGGQTTATERSIEKAKSHLGSLRVDWQEIGKHSQRGAVDETKLNLECEVLLLRKTNSKISLGIDIKSKRMIYPKNDARKCNNSNI
jgi:hypothetical protein